MFNLIISDPSILQRWDSGRNMAFDLPEAIRVLLSGDVNHQGVRGVGRGQDVTAPFTAQPAWHGMATGPSCF